MPYRTISGKHSQGRFKSKRLCPNGFAVFDKGAITNNFAHSQNCSIFFIKIGYLYHRYSIGVVLGVTLSERLM
jgi:hypothetical protein